MYLLKQQFQIRIFDFVFAQELTDHQFTVRVNDESGALGFRGIFEAGNKSLILRHIIRRLTDVPEQFCQYRAMFVLENDANPALTRIPASGTIGIRKDRHMASV
jgi:uncharacterized protein YutD